MDAQMEGLSGVLLVEQLRAFGLAMIFVMSASQPCAELLAAADGFLLKPFSFAELQKLIPQRNAQGASLSLTSDEEVISRETLAQLRSLMPAAAIHEIFTAVVVDLARRISFLDVAIAKGDAAEVRRIGHAIKGGCAMAGAVQAAKLGALIEAGALEVPDRRTSTLPPKSYQLDNNAPVLRDLRTAAATLERMLSEEFPA
jgi:HPt (histidine-containing phosphotransfer) domain-containing protein